MRNFQKNGEKKHFMQSKIFLIFLCIIILIFFFSMFSFVDKMRDTQKNKDIIKDKIAELEKSKQTFNSEITKLKTEEGIEENIREKFGVVKEGENLMMVVDDKNPLVEEKEENNKDFWSIIKSWLK
ncbi:MAG: septum formation initiator family protein [Candidatus Paceibacterota bacterium]